jgi:His Kinase A (phospho-acceptor) domain
MERWLENYARTAFGRSGDTAHDLKTPLNIAVLNLELVRIQLQKLEVADDEKVAAALKSIEGQLRRMAQIIDVFFASSAPPSAEGEPVPLDAAALIRGAASDLGIDLASNRTAIAVIHESRIREAAKLFFEGTLRLLDQPGWSAHSSRGRYAVAASGGLRCQDLELTKAFQFDYTDPSGNPELSLATARLIVETYGGALEGTREGERARLELSLPARNR